MTAPEFQRIAEQHQDEIVALARDLVRIDTTNTGVMPTGHETAAASHLQSVLRAAGVEAEIHGRVPERGSLFAALPGRSGRTALLLLSHSDVVPSGNPSQWTHPPFAGAIEDGHLHGRGASDMKGTVAAEAMALILLHRLRVPLGHGVGMVCVADEEAGGAYGAGWIAQAHPDRLRAGVCLNEGGGAFVSVEDSEWCLLGVGEKGRYEVSAEFHGKGSHAARPWQGDNALYRAAAAIERLRAYEPERDTSGPIFETLGRVVGPVTPGNVDAVIERFSRTAPRLADHLRQVSRLLVTPTLIAGGVKSNSVPDQCRLTCDVRALPHQPPAYIEEELRRLLGPCDLRIEPTAVANASPAPDGVLAMFAEVLGGVLGRPIQVVPTISGAFTDSRFVRPLGVRAYGFAPGRPESDPTRHNAHGPNESVAVGDLVVQTAVYMEVAHRLAAAA